MTMPYEPVIGFEIHAQARTQSKRFCGEPTVLRVARAIEGLGKQVSMGARCSDGRLRGSI